MSLFWMLAQVDSSDPTTGPTPVVSGDGMTLALCATAALVALLIAWIVLQAGKFRRRVSADAMPSAARSSAYTRIYVVAFVFAALITCAWVFAPQIQQFVDHLIGTAA